MKRPVESYGFESRPARCLDLISAAPEELQCRNLRHRGGEAPLIPQLQLPRPSPCIPPPEHEGDVAQQSVHAKSVGLLGT